MEILIFTIQVIVTSFAFMFFLYLSSGIVTSHNAKSVTRTKLVPIQIVGGAFSLFAVIMGLRSIIEMW
jgi:TRAP-type C4-dicarboxylate transport system permease small subunit